ncbi:MULTISPECIES: ribulokinase [unclassified Allomuricauda]|uniref:ribulokinase n=1 Tax=unclassified Allomuricauda TaxID=2615049 RepID=UPI00056154F8|nr:ribulokinase [Muricauda sp. MAR_2010_75]
MASDDYVIGVDFGTGSVRALLVNAHNGDEMAFSEFEYPRWKKGMYCDAVLNQFRQHPLDYIEGLEHTVSSVAEQVGADIVEKVRAISVDTTGSTPVAVDKTGQPLALQQKFEHNPNAMFILWKDHSAMKEADEINTHATNFDQDYLKYSGGIYSSEWFWAKLLYVLRVDKDVAKSCFTWVEHCDWIPFLLTGGNDAKKIKRGVCAAGHKALWADEHGGLPPKEFFTTLAPVLENLEHPLFTTTFNSDKSVGNLSQEWAKRLGLSTNVLIGVGALDAHVGAVGGQIEPFYLSKVMGTSTCDMMVVPTSDDIAMVRGICGQVRDSIVPGMVGLEAGQSAFGDVYAWFQELLVSTGLKAIRNKSMDLGIKAELEQEITHQLLEQLGKEASNLPLEENSEMAIDWFNGRRTPDANPYVKGTLLNLNLGSDAARIYRALVESTCFGAKIIVDHFEKNNISLKGVIALGGVARKSDYVMQMMSNVLNLPVKVHNSEQTCAMGACMFASVVGNIHNDVEEAMTKMGKGYDKSFMPESDRVETHKRRYNVYKKQGVFQERILNKE